MRSNKCKKALENTQGKVSLLGYLLEIYIKLMTEKSSIYVRKN